MKTKTGMVFVGIGTKVIVSVSENRKKKFPLVVLGWFGPTVIKLGSWKAIMKLEFGNVWKTVHSDKAEKTKTVRTVQYIMTCMIITGVKWLTGEEGKLSGYVDTCFLDIYFLKSCLNVSAFIKSFISQCKNEVQELDTKYTPCLLIFFFKVPSDVTYFCYVRMTDNFI